MTGLLHHLTRRSLIALLLLAGCLAPRARAINVLTWTTNGVVSAEIDGVPLSRFLEGLAGKTGWTVYLEPGTTHTVSAKFKDRKQGDALHLLLGDLSFALLPQTNGPAKFFVFNTSLDDATELIRPARDTPGREAKPIPDELIVRLKPGANIDDIAKRYGATVIGRSDKLNAYRLKFGDAASADAARKLLGVDSLIAGVESNYFMEHPPEANGLDMSSTPPLTLMPKPLGKGNPLIVGLIDTAVQTLGAGQDGFLLPQESVAGDAPASDCVPTHGTSMAQTILRGMNVMAGNNQAPSSVRILPVDVYGSHESTSTYDVALGFQAAINKGANIINMSLGGDGDSPLLHELVKKAAANNILIFAAAGNDGGTAPVYPAAYPEVMAVTAGNMQGQIAPYANHGDFVKLVLPGTAMVNMCNQTYAVTGTSTATANATAVTAIKIDQGKLSAAQGEQTVTSMFGRK